MKESFLYSFSNESNIPFLNELAEREGTFIEKITDTIHIGLLPSMLGRLKSGIIDNLNSMLRKYDPQLDGILVGYDNLAMLGTNGHMIPGYHHVHINVRADFYVFKPAVGGVLTGMVLKKSGTSATCLTNKVFTVFVTFPPNVRHCLHRVQLHQEITFTIERVDLLCQIPFVKGVLNEDSLPSGDSSDAASVSGDMPDAAHSRKQKSHRHQSMATESAELDSTRKPRKRQREEAEEREQEQTSPRKAKRQRRRELAAGEGVQPELYLADAEPPTSSNTKKKKKTEQAGLNGSVSGMLR